MSRRRPSRPSSAVKKTARNVSATGREPVGSCAAPVPASAPVPAFPSAAAPAAAGGQVMTFEQAMGLAIQHHQNHRLTEAENIYRQILAARPGFANARHLLGMIFYARDDLETAEQLVISALVLEPGLVDAFSNLGIILKKQGRIRDAITSYRRALSLRPDFVEGWCNLGNAYHLEKCIPEAIAAYKEAQRIRPEHRQTYISLGILYRDEGYPDEGLAAFDRAVAMQPDDLGVRFDRALALLVSGDLKRGFEEYELRWDQDHLKPHRKDFPQPLWQGQNPAGMTLLVHGEQGFGDTLQFVRYIPLLAERGAKVLLAVQPQLDRVMKTLDGVSYLHPSGQVVPPFHMHTPLISLPRIFGTTLATIPRNVPYLKAEPELLARWGARLGPRDGRVRVGIAWAGVPTFKADGRRSPRLEPLLPLLEVPGVIFYSLQMGHGRKDLEGRRMPENFIDLGDEITDFADTAAIMSHVDVFISSCTGPAHLAGALGIPMWVMLYSAADWRWLYTREDSPWYPSARLFRQNPHGIGGWQPVVERVRAALTRLAAGDRSQLLPPPPEASVTR